MLLARAFEWVFGAICGCVLSPLALGEGWCAGRAIAHRMLLAAVLVVLVFGWGPAA
jgi:hypothetical protein